MRLEVGLRATRESHNGSMRRWIVVLCCLAMTLASSSLSAQTVAAPDGNVPSFGSLFRALPSDFAHLITPEAVTILGAGAGLSLALHPADARLTRDAASAETLEFALDPGQIIGDSFVQEAGAFATYLAGRMSHNARLATVGAELVRAQIVTEALTQVVKVSVRRRRPDGSNLSFPSGHTSATVATAAVLQREFGWKVGGIAYAAAAYVATSRLSENKHYASDLAFGAAIGLLAGRRITMLHRGNTMTLAPLALPGGGGVAVTWTPAR
jgi:membrane-associated phospholipid phosphatase